MSCINRTSSDRIIMCSRDAINHLSEHMLYCHAYYIPQIDGKLQYSYTGYEKFGIVLLLKNLTDEEITLLSLKCEELKIVDWNDISPALQNVWDSPKHDHIWSRGKHG